LRWSEIYRLYVSLFKLDVYSVTANLMNRLEEEALRRITAFNQSKMTLGMQSPVAQFIRLMCLQESKNFNLISELLMALDKMTIEDKTTDIPQRKTSINVLTGINYLYTSNELFVNRNEEIFEAMSRKMIHALMERRSDLNPSQIHDLLCLLPPHIKMFPSNATVANRFLKKMISMMHFARLRGPNSVLQLSIIASGLTAHDHSAMEYSPLEGHVYLSGHQARRYRFLSSEHAADADKEEELDEFGLPLKKKDLKRSFQLSLLRNMYINLIIGLRSGSDINWDPLIGIFSGVFDEEFFANLRGVNLRVAHPILLALRCFDLDRHIEDPTFAEASETVFAKWKSQQERFPYQKRGFRKDITRAVHKLKPNAEVTQGVFLVDGLIPCDVLATIGDVSHVFWLDTRVRRTTRAIPLTVTEKEIYKHTLEMMGYVTHTIYNASWLRLSMDDRLALMTKCLDEV